MECFYRYLTLMTMIALPLISAADIQFDDDNFIDAGDEAPVLISPTRLKQSKHDIPSSVSTITREDILALQLRTIPEALRYITGMAVKELSGNDARVNYHGTSGLAPRRMQVLIDGMSVFRSGYAEVVWSTLPVTMQDIERIEVTRSPSSPTYGQNSMMAVINIITRSALESGKGELSVRYGSNDTLDTYASISGLGTENLDAWISIGNQMDEGFDKNFRGDDRHDGINMNHLNAKVNYRFNTKTHADIYLGFSHGAKELEFRDIAQISFPDTETESQYYNIDINHTINQNHALTVSFDYVEIDNDVHWQTCPPLALFLPSLGQLHRQNPQFAAQLANNQTPTEGSPEDFQLGFQVLGEIAALGPRAFIPACGTFNENANETKADLEIEDTYIFNENIRGVFGIGGSTFDVSTETFFGGKLEVNTLRAFSNIEYRLSSLVINAGLMLEHESSDSEVFASPRLGLNYRLSDQITLRYAVSKAHRTPDVFETSTNNWTYTSRNNDQELFGSNEHVFYYTATSNGDVVPEEIVSQEAGLYFYDKMFNSSGSTVTRELDLKLFYDEMDNLISEKIQFFDYNPTNNSENILHGVEFDVNVTITGDHLLLGAEKIKFHAGYSYLDLKTENVFERTLYSRHIGNFYSILKFPDNISFTLGYNGSSPMDGEAYDAFETAINKTFKAMAGDLNIGLRVLYRPDKEYKLSSTDAVDIKNIQNESASYYLTTSYTF
jgi:iron complex outermembrane receptor protein